MKIALFGVNGMIGQRILQEALSRGHQVTAVVRNPNNVKGLPPQVNVVEGDVLDSASVAKAVAGYDAVISAVGPGRANPPEMLVQAARALIVGVKQAGVKRLLVVGGTGSLQVAPGGILVLDTPEFPAAWRPTAVAHRDALDVYKTADLDWTFFSPASTIEPGKRTEKYRTGADVLLIDAEGKSYISAEDFAVALLDELEKPKALRKRITIAY